MQAPGRTQTGLLGDWQPEELKAEISPTVSRKKAMYDGKRLQDKNRE